MITVVWCLLTAGVVFIITHAVMSAKLELDRKSQYPKYLDNEHITDVFSQFRLSLLQPNYSNKEFEEYHIIQGIRSMADELRNHVSIERTISERDNQVLIRIKLQILNR